MPNVWIVISVHYCVLYYIYMVAGLHNFRSWSDGFHSWHDDNDSGNDIFILIIEFNDPPNIGPKFSFVFRYHGQLPFIGCITVRYHKNNKNRILSRIS